MIRLYSNEETFDLSADLDWITQQIAVGGRLADRIVSRAWKRTGSAKGKAR